jgi:trehalose 6-phosphate phosphatase
MTLPGDVTAIVSALTDATATHLLLLFDFDGTLSEFAATPAAARLPAARQRLLAELATRPHTTVGVVSGRRLQDLRGKVDLGPSIFYAGLHGMEIEGGGERFLHEGAREGQTFIQQLRPRLEDALADLAGVVVEDKEYSVVVHWRLAALPVKTAASQVLSRLAEAPRRARQVRLQPGHEMCEVLPNVAWNKGSALQWMERHVAARLRSRLRTMYVGDDLTDEDAFLALGPSGLGVLVGRPRPTAARFRLSDPPAVEALLRMLVAMPVAAPEGRAARTPA